MPPTAKSLVVDLLSTLTSSRGPAGSLPVRALVAAADLFGIAENNLRVTLARLCAAGVVEHDERGRYRLGAAGARVNGIVRAWRGMEQRVRPWDGAWVGVLASTGEAVTPRARPSSKAARLEVRSLGLLGFRCLRPGLWLRPDNLAVGVAGLGEQLRELAPVADEAGAGRIVCRLDAFDSAHQRAARALWDVAGLQRGYTRARRALAASERRLARMSNEKAMVESFLVGGQVLRQLVLDPLLPEPICAAAPRRALVEAMLRYDRLGRDHWRDFLDAHDLPERVRARRGPAAPSLASPGELA